MDVSEKLVELLRNGILVAMDEDNRYLYSDVVEYMIANGVTVQENCKACAEATQNCIVKLQEQIAKLRSVQEWISVKDRLPEKNDRYLCNVKCFSFPDLRYFAILKYDEGGFIEGKIYTDDVTHWMPLPKPPKGE